MSGNIYTYKYTDYSNHLDLCEDEYGKIENYNEFIKFNIPHEIYHVIKKEYNDYRNLDQTNLAIVLFHEELLCNDFSVSYWMKSGNDKIIDKIESELSKKKKYELDKYRDIFSKQKYVAKSLDGSCFSLAFRPTEPTITYDNFQTCSILESISESKSKEAIFGSLLPGINTASKFSFTAKNTYDLSKDSVKEIFVKILDDLSAYDIVLPEIKIEHPTLEKTGNRPCNCIEIERKHDCLYPVVPKGRKAEIQAAADAVEETLNEFIVKAIDERMERLRTL